MLLLLVLQNESEILPFPNKNIDFQLPDPDFEDLRQKDFPRMGNTQNQLLEEEVKTKAEGDIFFLKYDLLAVGYMFI